MGDVVPGLATTRKWTGSCAQPAEQLQSKIKDIVDEQVQIRNEEIAAIEQDMEARKTGGFWDKITAGPLEQFRKTMETATNPQDSMSGQNSLLGKYTSYLDQGKSYVGLASGLISGVMSTVVNELDVINAVSDTLGLGTLMPTGQGSSCDKGIILGTVDSIVAVAASAITPVVNQAMAAQATIGLGFSVIPDLYGALASLPVGTLSLLLTNKKTLLDRIESTVNSAVVLADEMKDADYPYDHVALIERSMASLEEVDGDLAQLNSVLMAGGLFSRPLWDDSKLKIWDVSEDLMGSGSVLGGFAFSKVLQLFGYQKQLETLIDIMTQRQAAINELIAAVGGFTSTFDQDIKFQNMMAPIVQQVRCSLQQIISDMGDTLTANRLLRYYASEKKWGIELAVLANYMDGTDGLGNDLTHAPTELNKAADVLSANVSASMDFFISEDSYDALVSRLNVFMSELKRKIASNVNATALQALAVAIGRELTIQRESNSGLETALNNFNQSIAGTGLEALQLVQGVMSLLDEQGLNGMTDALRNGDFKSFFSGDMLQKMAESAARKTLADVMQCCEDNAGDGDLAEKAIKINGVLSSWQKGKDMYDRYTGRFNDEHLKETYRDTIPGLMRLNRDAATMTRSRCINSGQAGVTKGLGLTLI